MGLSPSGPIETTDFLALGRGRWATTDAEGADPLDFIAQGSYTREIEESK